MAKSLVVNAKAAGSGEREGCNIGQQGGGAAGSDDKEQEKREKRGREEEKEKERKRRLSEATRALRMRPV
jgi:hypothetical protein